MRLAQDISTAEEEAAKKKVGSAAAMKQLEKLRKEGSKTSKEAERTADELSSKKEEHKVSPWMDTCPWLQASDMRQLEEQFSPHHLLLHHIASSSVNPECSCTAV